MLLLTSSGYLFADDKPSRQKRQRERIQNGVESGALTKREEKRLNNQMEKIQDVKDGIRADGIVTKVERAYVKDLRDKQSDRIYKQKHDAQVNPEAMSRGQKQRLRIENGVKSGALTKREEKRLNNQMERIRDVREGMRADGEVSDTEKAYVQKLRDEQSERIYKQKHDDQSSDFVQESYIRDSHSGGHSHQ